MQKTRFYKKTSELMTRTRINQCIYQTKARLATVFTEFPSVPDQDGYQHPIMRGDDDGTPLVQVGRRCDNMQCMTTVEANRHATKLQSERQVQIIHKWTRTITLDHCHPA
jgi:hypothetical protein